mgnify:CR=1 FL=1
MTGYDKALLDQTLLSHLHVTTVITEEPTDGVTDRQTDRRTNGPADRPTDRLMSVYSVTQVLRNENSAVYFNASYFYYFPLLLLSSSLLLNDIEQHVLTLPT